MEVPSPASGKVLSLLINEGDKASEGSAVLVLEVQGAAPATSAPAPSPAAASSAPAPAVAPAVAQKGHRTSEQFPQEIQSRGSEVYAGPAARKLAREMAIDLSKVTGTGPRSRISKDDIKAFVKSVMQNPASTSTAGGFRYSTCTRC